MGVQILDGRGSGARGGVNEEHQQLVESVSQSIQHHVSLEHGLAFQAIGDFLSVNNSTHSILHIRNTSTSKKLIITYIRLQALDLTGGTAIPSAENRFEIGYGRTYASGGTLITAVNMNRSSGQVADSVIYDNNPTLAGTFLEMDRWYLGAQGNMMTFNKEGSVILGQNDTFEIRFVSDHTAGVAYARASFIYRD